MVKKLRKAASHVVPLLRIKNDPFSVGRTNPKFPLPAGNLDPHLIGLNGSLGPHESAPKRHLDRFSRFCRAQERDQQTDTQTNHATPSVLCSL